MTQGNISPIQAAPHPIDPGVRIGHVHLRTADIDRVRAFYVDVLGFDVVAQARDVPGWGTTGDVLFVSAGGYHHHLGFNTWKSAGGGPQPDGVAGLHHVAINYPTRAGLADAVRRLQRAGVPLRQLSDHGTHEAVYLSDPDGNDLELAWDRPIDQWPQAQGGGLAPVFDELDLDDLLSEPEPKITSNRPPDLLALSPDELLSTTRAVRKRLDLDRPVPLEVIREALAVALQAPSGGNSQRWHWLVLTDPGVKARVAEFYKRSHLAYSEARPKPADAATARLAASSDYLREVMARVPVLVIGAIAVGDAGLPEGNQAGLWGSLLPAAWSLALALRARGLGTAWTTLHLRYEREVAEVLGLPAEVRQGVLLPVAYTKGTDFKPGPRADLDAVVHLNGW